MPRQNRVTPQGTIIAHPGRGLFTGNRGCLVNSQGEMTGRRWASKAWITCDLEYKGNCRTIMQPNTWTELFFLDEAVAFAAGHRPCATCRRADYNRFRAAWSKMLGAFLRASEMDRHLHNARLTPERRQQTCQCDLGTLPDGSFILHDNRPMMVRGRHLFPYRPEGYGAALPRPRTGKVVALTPAPLIAILRGGYDPVLHDSAS